jgi:ribosome-associated protein
MIRITPAITLDEAELQWEFIHSSGPGGQHVNKAATAAQLRFDAGASGCLPAAVRQRLLRTADRRITAGGVIIITARRFRSREQNRADALQRLIALVRSAAHRPERRIPTQPTRAAQQRRCAGKKLRGKTKALRRQVPSEDD